MKKRSYLPIVAGFIILQSCITVTKEKSSSIQGTWKLVSGTTIQDKDTVHTDYTRNQEMIKIINNTHFAFLRHDLNRGKDSSAVFVAGGGKYTLEGNKYTEYLEYFNVREWEG